MPEDRQERLFPGDDQPGKEAKRESTLEVLRKLERNWANAAPPDKNFHEIHYKEYLWEHRYDLLKVAGAAERWFKATDRDLDNFVQAKENLEARIIEHLL